MQITGIDATMRELHAEIDAFEKRAVAEVKRAAHLLMTNLFENTPVWQGSTVRNYAWGVGRLPSGGARSAIGSGNPGPTNTMVMGAEPRRGANEAAALQDMETVLVFTKLTDLFVTNLVDAAKWDRIDNGAAPSPGKARNPGGVSILAMQSTRNALEHWK